MPIGRAKEANASGKPKKKAKPNDLRRKKELMRRKARVRVEAKNIRHLKRAIRIATTPLKESSILVIAKPISSKPILKLVSSSKPTKPKSSKPSSKPKSRKEEKDSREKTDAKIDATIRESLNQSLGRLKTKINPSDQEYLNTTVPLLVRQLAQSGETLEKVESISEKLTNNLESQLEHAKRVSEINTKTKSKSKTKTSTPVKPKSKYKSAVPQKSPNPLERKSQRKIWHKAWSATKHVYRRAKEGVKQVWKTVTSNLWRFVKYIYHNPLFLILLSLTLLAFKHAFCQWVFQAAPAIIEYFPNAPAINSIFYDFGQWFSQNILDPTWIINAVYKLMATFGIAGLVGVGSLNFSAVITIVNSIFSIFASLIKPLATGVGLAAKTADLGLKQESFVAYSASAIIFIMTLLKQCNQSLAWKFVQRATKGDGRLNENDKEELESEIEAEILKNPSITNEGIQAFADLYITEKYKKNNKWFWQ